MRGKVVDAVFAIWSTRITPAYAGKSDGAYIISDFLRGSPPPMRGKALFRRSSHSALRITPAYAGKRRKVSSVSEM